MSRVVRSHNRIIRWLPSVAFACMGIAVAGFSGQAHAVTISMQALTSFGSSGWLQPSSFPGVTGTNNDIRSIAFNQATGSLLYASANTVIPVNATTGAIGTALPSTGIAGGTKVFNTVAVTTDGVIYGTNLSANSTTTAFRVYRWANQSASAPTVHYSGNAGLAGVRVGDDLAVFGADGTGLLAAGFSNSPTVAGNNTFATISTGTSVAASVTPISVSGTPPNAGDFRVGITFADSDTVLGTQGSATIRRVSFSGATGALDGSNTLNTTNERGILYFNAYDTPLLATIVTGSVSSMNTVRLYNASNLSTTGTASYLTQINLASSNNGNGNASGALAFGVVGGMPTLYALNTNNGIQAIQVVPEPSTTVIVAGCTAGLAALLLRRRQRSE